MWTDHRRICLSIRRSVIPFDHCRNENHQRNNANKSKHFLQPPFPDDFFDILRILHAHTARQGCRTYARNQQLHGVGDSGMLPNRLPTREVQMLKKPTLCIFFITRYISHSIRHPVPLILFDRSAAGDGLGQFHSISKSLRPRSGTARLCPCCTWRSCARSLPSTRAHASARCSLLAHSRSPRGPKTASAVRSA